MKSGHIIALLAGAVIATSCSAGYNANRIVDPRYECELSSGEPVDRGELLGEASWYGERFHGRTTASGEPFDMYQFTAAHRTLPFGTIVRVVREDTLQSVVVRITDRGPYSDGRIIDLSWAAAYDLNLIERGHTAVWLEVLECE